MAMTDLNEPGVVVAAAASVPRYGHCEIDVE
jgi:hypothetical protein